MLSPMDPVLRGPLADEKNGGFDAWGQLDEDVFADCIEIDVEGDTLTLVHLLARLGYRAEHLTGEVFLVEEALVPIEITVKKQIGLSQNEPTCDAATLERRLWSWLSPWNRELLR